MKTIRRNLDDIRGIELNNKQKLFLKGGDELPGVCCISCKDADWEFLGNVEFEDCDGLDAMVAHCKSEGYPDTSYVAYTRNPCDIQ